MRKAIDFLLNHPIAIIVLVCVCTLFAGFIASGVRFDFNLENMFPDRHPDREIYDEFHDVFGEDDSSYIIALEQKRIFDLQTLLDIRRLTHRLEDLKEISEVTSLSNVMFPRTDTQGVRIEKFYTEAPQDPSSLQALFDEALANPVLPQNLISLDGTTTAIRAKLHPDYNHHSEREKLEPIIRSLLAEFECPGRTIYLGGPPVLRTTYIQLSRTNLILFIPLSGLMIIFVLGVLFREPSGTWLPMGLVAISAVATVAIMAATDVPFNLLTNVLPSVIVVVGVADSIHLLIKYREEYLADNNQRRALGEALRKIAIACFFTSVTTAIGFSSLATSSNHIIRQFGMIAAVGVVSAYIVTILLLPAVLSLIKPPSQKRVREIDEGFLARAIRRGVGGAVRHPWKTIGAFALIAGLSFIGIARIQNQYFFMQDLGPEVEIRRVHEFIDEKLGCVAPFEIDIRSRSGREVTNPEFLQVIDDLTERMRSYEGVGKVLSLADLMKEMNRLMNGGGRQHYRLPQNAAAASQYLLVYSLGTTDPTADFITFDRTRTRVSSRTTDMGQMALLRMREDLREYIEANIDPDLQVHITGAAQMVITLTSKLVSDMMASLALAFAVIFFLVLAQFRSLKLALISMAPNLAPLVVIAGFMGFAGITLNPTTAVSFVVAFGIAVDDTIHFLVRFRQEFPKDQDHAAAIMRTSRGTGRAIVLTSMILTAGFVILTLSNFTASRHFGLLVSLIMVVALFADLILLPAMLMIVKPRVGSRK